MLQTPLTKMTWNIRLVQTSTEFEEYYELREVYYNEVGQPCGHIPLHAYGNSRQEVARYIAKIQEAMRLPSLSFKDWSHANPTKEQ